MLHTQSQGHWPFGSVEEDFLKVFFTIYWYVGHLGHVTKTIYKRWFTYPKESSYES